MKDAVVVGSGPNGLSAAIRLAQAGAEVLVLEAKDTPGGGMRTAEITLPGFHHDLCSGCHPTGVLSPYWSTLPLAAHGLRWCFPKASVAHPLDDEPAVLLTRDVRATAENLGVDARAYERLCKPFGKRSAALLRDALAPLGVPKDPITLARFGLRALLPAQALARTVFRGPRARALLAGNAGHSVLPLDMVPSGALGLMFLVMGHAVDWPVAEGGSASITRALVSLLESLGGRVETGRFVRGLDDLPAARVYLFDTSPAQLANVCAPVLPAGYVRRLRRYRYGPGAFKVDWALSEPIPWKDPRVRDASTVHLGGTLEAIAASERAMWEGRHTDDPYMILVQQSEHDPSRAPAGQHTGYAYCHVPAGSTEDRTDVLEAQIERFAPGFRDVILARKSWNAPAWEAHNPNYVGGAITGGAADLTQLFTRPVARLDPYTTPNRRVFLCGAATPPGGGVHGMGGFHAAESALKQLYRFPARRLK